MTSLFVRLVLLATSIALFAFTVSASSHHSSHNAKLRTHIHFPWSSGTPSADNTTASHSSSSPPTATTPTPSSTPAVTNLISIKNHSNDIKKLATEAEKENARKISLANSPPKDEPRAYPAKGDEITQYLFEHNRKREKHGLSALKWDNKLAEVAAKWIPHLRPHCGLQHSPATKDFRANIKGDKGNYPLAGENLMAHYGSSDTQIAAAVQSWIDEEQCYKYGPISAPGTAYTGPNCKMQKDKEQVGHYTQLMSDTATHLGCASFYCGKKQFLTYQFSPPRYATLFGYVYACEYGNANGSAAGNARGSYPFSEAVARNIGLPFLGRSSPIPPIDMGSAAEAKSSAPSGGGARNPLLDFFNFVDGKYVPKTPAELAAAAKNKEGIPETAIKVKGGKNKKNKGDKKNKNKKNKSGKNKKKKMLMLASLQSDKELLRKQYEKMNHDDEEDDTVDTSLLQLSEDEDEDDENHLDDDDEVIDNGDALIVDTSGDDNIPDNDADNDDDSDTDSDQASTE